MPEQPICGNERGKQGSRVTPTVLAPAKRDTNAMTEPPSLCALSEGTGNDWLAVHNRNICGADRTASAGHFGFR
jgi:hypothetical protein